MEPSGSDLRFGYRVIGAVGLLSAAVLSCFVGADVGALDAGELGGAAFALGVPHPTGFPLDMLLLRASAALPLGSLAFRQNLCVSWLAAAAVSCVAYLSMRWAQRCGWTSRPALAVAAAVSAASLLSSRTLLDAALNVEVYATSLLCLALAGLLTDAQHAAARRAVWPLAGLALGAHITAPLLIAPLLVAAARRERVRTLLVGLIGALSGALILSYVPLASLRDTAFDWGDPQTLERWFRHLSAARIREAYASSIFTGESLPRVHFLEQLAEQPLSLLLAGVGALGLMFRQRQRALVLGVLLCLDVAYAAWINPMGVAQRQVGHASNALIALCAGCGSALIVERAYAWRPRLAHVTAALAVCGALWLACGAVTPLPGNAGDGYAVSERYGSASPLSDLPPRAVFVCESDSSCAGALFSLYAEGVRPDLDVVPAQHLWEPTVLRRLRGLPLTAAKDSALWPPAEQRADSAERRLQLLIAEREIRPLYTEHSEHMVGSAVAFDHVPLLGIKDGALDLGAGTRQLADVERARFGDAGPSTTLQRELWASAHDTLGQVYLRQGHDQLAVAEYARAVSLTPLRATAVSNLGVALERHGDLDGALQKTARAVELDPWRATPWVNLARLLWRVHGPEAARAALIDASRFAVKDPRLEEIAQRLAASDAGAARGE